ncbi:hypothetical protein GCM10009092_22620 [Bowmanella denitrificans]|uniref:ATP-grasp domain-containing protein n=1 Tax=Bowmanella denitrificans TaxID=366582 RepID=A0ABN0X8J2_9ALTE
MQKKILIITNSHDLHADLLDSKLQRKGHQPFRVNLDHFPCDYHIQHTFSHGQVRGKLTHLPSLASLKLEEVAAVWLRKPADYRYFSDDLSAQERAFAKLETDQAMFGWLYCLDCYWISHPLSLRGAMWKTEQLNRAQALGFCIPDSLVTNYPDDVKSFADQLHSPMIFKTLSSPDLGADQVNDSDVHTPGGLATTLVSEEMLSALDAVREVPCHFQRYIDKEYELRVTIIGQHVFAAKIHSQDDERTKVDSRDMSAEILYEATQLPADVEKRCLALVKSYGLNFSALDIVVTRQGEYVFLENNPNGQFLYVEQLIPEFTMLDCLADTLIQEVKCRS